jgi:DNA repair protein RadA/Sms
MVSAMTKLAVKTTYRCGECGWTSAKWLGRCGECQAWGSMAEGGAAPAASVQAVTPLRAAVPITEVDAVAIRRSKTGIGELDRVLGGGLVPGSVVLLAGEPGVGKSTLLLAAAAGWARDHGPTLYVTGEESAGQVRLRALRTGSNHRDLYLAAETDLATVLGHIDQVEPALVVVDSVQTIAADGDGSVGGVAQVKAVASALAQVAKRRGLPVILVGHVTKDGSVAGPRTLEHLVDVVISFEGDPHSGFRLIRATKNRFGPADEVGCFELTEGGIREVPDPSGHFRNPAGDPVTGTALAVTLEGRRPLLAEIQALVAPTAAPPRRVAHGLDSGRLAMVLAVLQRRAKIKLHVQDVYASTVGGARLTDPACDLALASAIVSAAKDCPVPAGYVALGEIGLAGELRRVPALMKRLGEAARLGVTQAIVPAGSLERRKPAADRRLAAVTTLSVKDGRPDMTVVESPTLAAALAQLGLTCPVAERAEFGPVMKWGQATR